MERKYCRGEQVQLTPTTLNKRAAPGPYEVMRELPYDSGEFRYQVSSNQEAYERVVTEDELQQWDARGVAPDRSRRKT